jgi:ankyrin repeat/BTB/POZ domain-containing protein 1
MDEDGEVSASAAQAVSQAATATDEPISANEHLANGTPDEGKRNLIPGHLLSGEIRTLDGDIAGDEFSADAINYQVLLGKIDKLLERLNLDA